MMQKAKQTDRETDGQGDYYRAPALNGRVALMYVIYNGNSSTYSTAQEYSANHDGNSTV